MNTRLRLMSVASLLLMAVTGCNAPSATLSDEKLTNEEILSIKEGTNFPRHSYNAIIYDRNKMLFIYSSGSCVKHPERVAVEGHRIKVTFSKPEPGELCKMYMTGPLYKVINLPNESVPKNYYRVTAIVSSDTQGTREINIPVLDNSSP